MAESLASYVPLSTIRHCFELQAGTVWAPRVESFDGAVVFCDIAGFTPLTEKYAREGPDGAEKLVSFLNSYFGRLIEMVHDHGGDVILFAGDALIAMWGSVHNSDSKAASSQEILRECAFAAVKCAATIDAAVNSDPNSEDPRLHMGVGAGKLHFLQVGGVQDSWTYLLCGEPLAQIALGGSLSSHGTVVSPQVWELVNPMFHGGPVQIKAAAASLADQADGFVQISTPKDPFVDAPVMTQAVVRTTFEARVTGSLRMFIPKVIQKNTKPGELTQVAELRRLTIVFMCIKNVKLTDADSLPRAHNVVQTIQTAFYKYGGVINKILLDDKGFILLAGFGLPPFAHEDDPERAVLASLSSQAALAAIGVVSAIGITTGTAFCGIVGSPERREYTVIGDAVNTAARLMTFTPDAIAMDTATVSSCYATGRRVTFERIGRKKFKGKADEMDVWAPSSVAERKGLKSLVDMELHNVALVGRSKEMLLIARALRARASTEEGHSSNLRIVCVEGEAGEGKTRVLEEAQRYAVALGYSVVQGAGSEIAKSTQFSAFAGVFEDILCGPRASSSLLPVATDDGLDIHDHYSQASRLAARTRTPAQQAALLYSIVDAELGKDALTPDRDPVALISSGVEPLLSAILPYARTPHPDIMAAPDTPRLGGRARLDAISALAHAVLTHQSKSSPTLLIIDDLNHLDSSSRSLLVSILNADLPGLMIITGARPFGHIPRFYGELLGDAKSQRSMTVSLGALPPCAIRQVVTARLEVKELPSVVEETIVSKTGGNPFFAEQMVHAMKSKGLISVQDSYCLIPMGVTTKDIGGMEVPGPLQAYIVSRMDRLSPEVGQVVKVAATIGFRFSAKILVQVHPARSAIKTDLWPMVEEQLQALISIGFVELVEDLNASNDGMGGMSGLGGLGASSSDLFAHLNASGGGGRGGEARGGKPVLNERSVFRFANKIIHEVVYDLLPYRMRKLLHAEVALCLEASSMGGGGGGGGSQTEEMEALFRHYCLSNLPNKAIPYGEILATRAMKSHDYDAAFSIRSRLLGLDLSRVPLVQLLSIRRKLAETAMLLGEEVDAVRYLLEALFLARDVMDGFDVGGLGEDGGDMIYPVLLWHCLDAEREARQGGGGGTSAGGGTWKGKAEEAVRLTRRASLRERVEDVAGRRGGSGVGVVGVVGVGGVGVPPQQRSTSMPRKPRSPRGMSPRGVGGARVAAVTGGPRRGSMPNIGMNAGGGGGGEAKRSSPLSSPRGLPGSPGSPRSPASPARPPKPRRLSSAPKPAPGVVAGGGDGGPPKPEKPLKVRARPIKPARRRPSTAGQAMMVAAAAEAVANPPMGGASAVAVELPPALPPVGEAAVVVELPPPPPGV